VTSSFRPRLLLALAAILPLGLALVACRPAPSPAPPDGRATLLDLAQLGWVAEHDGPATFVAFGTPAAQPWQDVGFMPAEPVEGRPSAWARRRAELFFVLTETRPRVLVLDLEPAEGLAHQSVKAWLNGEPLAELRLAPGRRRYRLDLPVPAQRRNNRLRMLFGERAEGAQDEPHRRAARFHAALLAAPDDPALLALLAPDGPPAFDVVAGETPRLLQLGSGAQRFTFPLPEQAELRAHPAVAGAGARLRVTLELEGQAPQELWSADVRGQGRELTLPLPGSVGRLARLSLEAQAAPGAAPVVGWGAPRLVGRGQIRPLLEPGPHAPADEARAEGLRRELARTRPNVLLVILDAARARSLGAYGYARRTTPEVDRLAQEGVLFEQAYTPAVFTLSAMASAWTSRYPDEHHAGVAHDAPLPADRPTLAERLAAAGVGTVGLVGNSMAGPAFGLARGFGAFEEVHLRKGNRAAAVSASFTDWLARRPADQRFFAYVHFREPHFPYHPLPPWDTLFGPDGPLGHGPRSSPAWYGEVNEGQRAISKAELAHFTRLYDGNLAYVDAQVGELRKALERRGLLEQTVVIVASDHGESFYEHRWLGHNQQVFEESTHVPLVLRFPGGTARGTRVRGLVDLLDLAPTVAELLGLPQDGGSGQPFAGRSLLPMVFGAPGKPATVAITTGELRGHGLRHERFKYVRNVRWGTEQLYDLERDPLERETVAAAHPVRVAYYRQELFRRVFRSLSAPARAAGPAKLSPEQLENLRSLGYVN